LNRVLPDETARLVRGARRRRWGNRGRNVGL
jgi:hypothetical protein